MSAHAYKVVIVGAGPAGIFAALELVRGGVTDVLVVEKGHAIAKRSCPARRTACVGCRTCDIMTGWGGAGAFSDGKLTLTTEVGGWLGDYVEKPELEQLLGAFLQIAPTVEPVRARAAALAADPLVVQLVALEATRPAHLAPRRRGQ